MIDLANSMSFVVSEIVHVYYPRKFIQFTVMLVPTPGKVAPDPDSIGKYGMNYNLFYGAEHEPERSICLALIGKATTVLRQWITDERAKYLADPLTCETQLRVIFEYVDQIGLAT